MKLTPEMRRDIEVESLRRETDELRAVNAELWTLIASLRVPLRQAVRTLSAGLAGAKDALDQLDRARDITDELEDAMEGGAE